MEGNGFSPKDLAQIYLWLLRWKSGGLIADGEAVATNRKEQTLAAKRHQRLLKVRVHLLNGNCVFHAC